VRPGQKYSTFLCDPGRSVCHPAINWGVSLPIKKNSVAKKPRTTMTNGAPAAMADTTKAAKA
jgi:hypothetical protein